VKTTHTTVLNTLTRVQRFLEANAATLQAVNASEYRAELDQSVTALESHAVTQAQSKRVTAAQTVKLRKLRETLKQNHIRPIARVAEARLRKDPDFVALRMPPGNSTSRRLIAAGGAMAKAAANHVPTFISAGLPADFLAKLQDATDVLSASLADRGHAATTGTGATKGLDAEMARGRKALKVVDALVVPIIAGDDALLAQWTSAKRYRGRAPNLTLIAADEPAGVAPRTQSPGATEGAGVEAKPGEVSAA
jgi:hypothetical protein